MNQSITNALQSNNNINVVGFGDEREKSHVIKVLKHETNIYKLETMINREYKGELSETSLDEIY